MISERESPRCRVNKTTENGLENQGVVSTSLQRMRPRTKGSCPNALEGCILELEVALDSPGETKAEDQPGNDEAENKRQVCPN